LWASLEEFNPPNYNQNSSSSNGSTSTYVSRVKSIENKIYQSNSKVQNRELVLRASTTELRRGPTSIFVPTLTLPRAQIVCGPGPKLNRLASGYYRAENNMGPTDSARFGVQNGALVPEFEHDPEMGTNTGSLWNSQTNRPTGATPVSVNSGPFSMTQPHDSLSNHTGSTVIVVSSGESSIVSDGVARSNGDGGNSAPPGAQTKHNEKLVSHNNVLGHVRRLFTFLV